MAAYKFCEKCRSNRSLDAKYCWLCWSLVTEFHQWLCECGNELGDIDNYCPQCGKATLRKTLKTA